MSETVIQMQNVAKLYKMGEETVHALRGISFKVSQGEFLSIMGPSGSGKSTCMNMIGCLDRPTSGAVEISGKNTSEMTEKELADLRNRTIGFVFQQYHLLAGLSVLENVMLPLRYQGIKKADRISLAKKALEQVNLSDRLNHRPHELSGGQKQRVLIAMAIINNPKLLIADEPTSGLDLSVQKQILELFAELKKELNLTMIIITHNILIAKKYCDYVVVMYKGEIVEQKSKKEIFENPTHEYTEKLLNTIEIKG